MWAYEKKIVTKLSPRFNSYRLEWGTSVLVDLASFAILSKMDGKGYTD